MNAFDLLMVDELRREFRRTRPPAKALTGNYAAGIFRVTSTNPSRIGFRVFWYPADLLLSVSICQHGTRFDLIEVLPP